MKQIFKAKIVCKSCKGTGIYTGFAERNGFGVVCYECKSTGKIDYEFEYEEFVKREEREDIEQVLQCNPGIGVGVNEQKGLTLQSFGGMSYKDWKAGKEFKRGTEMREFTCPAWFYQTANCDLKPTWNECMACGSFSSCKHFRNKAECWNRFDKEQAEAGK